QHGHTAADVGQKLVGGIFPAAKLDFEIFRFAADRVSGVKGSRWIYKESRAGKFAMLVAGLNFNDSFGGTLKNILNFATDGGGRLVLAAKQTNTGEETQRERKLRNRR